MYFDFDDHRPDTPRIPQAVSIRKTVLASVAVHLFVVVAYLTLPEEWFARDVDLPVDQTAELQPPDERPLRFIEVIPMVDRMERPDDPADLSDMDRRRATLERPPEASNPMPFMRGNSPEMIEGAPPAPPGPTEPPAPPPTPNAERPQPEMADASDLPPADAGFASLPPEPVPDADVRMTASLRDSLMNLQQQFREENFDNQLGGEAEQSADIQFDSMGVYFGSWLLRFKHQVERNWLVPRIPLTNRREDRVVIRFVVQRNGYITDLEVLQPASLSALTNAAVNSLRLSNPTAPLPPEYPRDQMDITVTYHYMRPRASP